jgi:hypothetical protein
MATNWSWLVASTTVCSFSSWFGFEKRGNGWRGREEERQEEIREGKCKQGVARD